MESILRFLVLYSEMDEALYCVQIGENSANFDFFMITKVSFSYLFRKRRGSAKASKTLVSTSSLTSFAITDETGELIAVPKICLYCFPRKIKCVELK